MRCGVWYGISMLVCGPYDPFYFVVVAVSHIGNDRWVHRRVGEWLANFGVIYCTNKMEEDNERYITIIK